MPGRIKLSGRRHKYNARATTVDNIRFASAAEAQRYGELKLLEQAGKIRYLVLQPKYPLRVNDTLLGHYIGDFSYFDVERSCNVVEDCKGVETPLFKWKRKHLEAHGITLTLVKMKSSKRASIGKSISKRKGA